MIGDQRIDEAFELNPIDRRAVVVVVAYQSDRWLRDCVRSLAESWNPRDVLLIVDNSGNSEIGAVRTLIPGTQVVATPKPLGFAEANNFGLVAAGLDSEAVCFLNQDTVGESGWLDACLDCLDNDREIGAVSPLLTTFDGNAWDEGFAHCVRNVPQLRDARPGDELDGQFEVPLLTAAAMVIRTELLQRIGPFDPVFGSYYEDFDLCRRVRDAGYRLAVCGNGVVRHFGGSSTQTSSQSKRRMQLIVRNRAIDRIRGGRTRRWGAILRQFAVDLPWNLARGLARTPSSQPPAVQCRAHLELLRLLPRLSSQCRDVRCWRQYLQTIHWIDPSEQGVKSPAFPVEERAAT